MKPCVRYLPALLVLLFLALQALLWLPGFSRYGAHPDEIGLQLWYMMPYGSNWRPQNFYYPTLYLYISKLTSMPVFAVLHFKLHLIESRSILSLNRVGRGLAFLVSSGILLLGYKTAHLLTECRKTALLSVLLIVTIPLFVNIGRFNTLDVPNTFFIMLHLCVAFHIARREPNARLYLLYGISAGLAIAAKYIGVIYVISTGAALLLCGSGASLPRRVSLMGAAAGASLLTFVVVSPYTVLEPGRFRQDLKWMMSVMPVYFGSDKPIGWIGFPKQIAQQLNPILVGFAVFGTWIVAKRLRNPARYSLLIALPLWYLYIGPRHFYPSRWHLPFLIIAELIAAVGIMESCRLLGRSSVRVARFAMVCAAIVAVAWQCRAAISVTYNFYHETRFEAADWIKSNLPPNERVGMRAGIFAYYPVPYLPNSQIYDFDKVSTSTGLLQAMKEDEVRYFVTSSLYVPETMYTDQYMVARDNALLEHAQRQKPVASFGMKGFAGCYPNFTEFLCPEIRIYEVNGEPKLSE